MKKKKIERLIYKSLDGKLTHKESESLKYELERSAEFESEYRNTIKLREEINKGAEKSFKPFFEERLLNRLHNSTGKIKYNPQVISLAISFRPIAVAAALILLLLLTYNLGSGNNYSINKLLGESQTNIEYAFDPLNNIFERAL